MVAKEMGRAGTASLGHCRLNRDMEETGGAMLIPGGRGLADAKAQRREDCPGGLSVGAE